LSRLLHVPGRSSLKEGTLTWAQVLKDHGYRTGTIGKWHLSEDPRDFGFDLNVGGGPGGSPPRGYFPPHPGAPGLEATDPDEYLTDRLTVEAERFIRQSNDRPWCLLLSHFAVHTPLQAKPEDLADAQSRAPGELHRSAVMAAMLKSLDEGVGNLLQLLETLGLDQRTVVIFTSDNGGYGPATSMHPLRGYKGTYHEGGIRVPLMVRLPGNQPPARIEQTPVIQLDWFPTLCEFAKIPLPTTEPLDGVSLAPLLQDNKELPPRSLFWHFPAYLESYAQRIDEQRDPLFRSRPCSVVRDGNWKLIHYYEDHRQQLFDLSRDVSEASDLSWQRPEVAAKLSGQLEAWRTELNAAIPSNENPAFDGAKEWQAQRRRWLQASDQDASSEKPTDDADQAELVPGPKTADRIVFLGDSITYAGHYIDLLEMAIRLEQPERRLQWLNLGLPSETVSGLSEDGHAGGQFPRPNLHERLERVLDQTKPDLIVACYGMNDGIYFPFGEDRFAAYKTGIRDLRTETQRRGIPILHLTPAMFDAHPIQARVLPGGLQSYPQPFEGYDRVLRQYADWLLMQRTDYWSVLDIHAAMNHRVAKEREVNPDFTMSPDGVHPNQVGHRVMASVLADAWNLTLPAEDAMQDARLKSVQELITRRQQVLKHAWLSHTKHIRPGLPTGMALEEATQLADEIEAQILQQLTSIRD
jgi:arylsulfatase A-like enzyme/lysophospholipase L1-like esterase